MPGLRPDDPYNPVPQVSPNTQAPNDTLNVRATPDQFGAQVGEAVQGVGQALQGASKDATQYVLQRQGLANENEANTNELQLAVEGGKKYEQLKNLTGLSASNAKDQYVQEYLDINKKIESNISNPAALKMYQSLATRRMSYMITDMNAYAADQRRSAYKQTVSDSVNLSVDRFNRNEVANSDEQSNFELGNIIHQVNTLYTAPDFGKYDDVPVKQGADGRLTFDQSTDVGKAAQADYDNYINLALGKAWETRIQTIANDIDHPDPIRAAQVLSQHKADMPAATYARLGAYLRAPLKTAQTSGFIDNAWTDTLNQYNGSVSKGSDLSSAFIQQESGNQGDNLGQIQPDTWKQYAKLGEDIHNPDDNRRVTDRILQDYSKKYNGDTGRIATAFFSGPGNVSDSGATPYKEDFKDKNGKSTSSYVADITKRLSNQSSSYQTQGDYFLSNYAKLTDQVEAKARQEFPDRPDLVETVVQKFQQKMNNQITQQNKTVDADSRTVYRFVNGTTNSDKKITSIDDLNNGPQEIKDAWMNVQLNDPVRASTIERLVQAQSTTGGSVSHYGADFWGHFQKVMGGQENVNHMAPYIGNKQDSPVTTAGYDLLSKEADQLTDPINKSFVNEEMKFLKDAHDKITGQNIFHGAENKEGEKAFNELLPSLIKQIQAGRADKKTSGQLFDPKSSDYVGKAVIPPSTSKLFSQLSFGGQTLNPSEVKEYKTPDELKQGFLAGEFGNPKSGAAWDKAKAYAVEHKLIQSKPNTPVSTVPSVPLPQ